MQIGEAVQLVSVGVEMGGETVPTVTLQMDMSAALLAISDPELNPFCMGLELIATKYGKSTWGSPLSPTHDSPMRNSQG